MTTPILVTGATGNVGSVLIELLRGRNAAVTAAVTHTNKALALESRGIGAVVIDFADTDSLIRAMDGVGCVFLLVPFGEPMAAWTTNAVRAARATGVEYLVRLSGFGADPDSKCLLNRVQGETDRIIQGSGLPYALLRPNAFMQNFSVYHAGIIRRQSAFYLPDGDGRTSFVDVRDIAAVAAEVVLDFATHQNRAYEITGPQALSGTEISGILSSVAGRAVAYRAVEETVAREGMRGLPAWNIDALLSLSAFVRAGGAATILETVKDIAGREPTNFERFAQDHAKAWIDPGAEADNPGNSHGST